MTMATQIGYCQSCGMPLTDEASHGTNADGSRHDEYCTYCYQNGACLSPNMTLDEMIETSARGWSNADPNVSYEDALKISKQNIPTLKRWQ